jgi:hypothetical protein
MKNKSKKYQYKIVEVSFDQAHLNNFSTDRGISSILVERSMSDRIIGGVYKKLKKKCMSNKTIQEILYKIEIEKRGGNS